MISPTSSNVNKTKSSPGKGWRLLHCPGVLRLLICCELGVEINGHSYPKATKTMCTTEDQINGNKEEEKVLRKIRIVHLRIK